MKNPFNRHLILFTLLLASISLYAQPKLNSLPTASATIFLDFDGHRVNSPIWNGGTAFTCAPTVMTTAQYTEVFNRVAEDYRPFNINITTDSTKFLTAPLARRMRIIVTPTSSWYQGVGGVAYIGSFTWGDDTPGFVFSDRLGPNSPKMIAECCSHESGHTVGLAHQSKYDGNCNLTYTYNEGLGTGETGWAPIMGNSYYRNMSGWNNGPTPYGCSNVQDNLSTIITQNGFGYRIDDNVDDISSNPTIIAPSAIGINGVISTPTDKDFFRINLSQTSNFILDVKPFSVTSNSEGANLDISVQLFNAAGTLVRVYNPLTTMAVNIDTILTSGTYYIAVDGTGNANVDNYGSLGAYSITGLLGTLPIRNVSLSGRVDKSKHALNWSITADEAIKNISIETSTDGIRFNTLNTLSNGVATNFNYTPYQHQDLYYRIKVTSVLNQSVYSNIVVLRASSKADQLFTVSTFVTNQITVNAATNFQYQLTDIKGNVISRGNGMQGFNQIDLRNATSGMYVIQLIGNNQQQVERIIKQ